MRGKNYWLLGTGITIFLIGSLHAFAADDDKWYVGKGAKENMHLKYEIEHLDTNNGQPFNMTISLVDFNSTGKYWVAPVSIEYQGHILNGTFHLHDSDMRVLNSSDIPSKMSVYKSGYELTLAWLSTIGYTDKSYAVQSLNDRSWSRIACLSCPEINNLGEWRITITAGTFDTTIMGSSDRIKIWINKDLPYPVKADHFDRLSENSSLLVFARFELLEVGGAGYVPVNVRAEDAVTAEEWPSIVGQASSFPLIVGIGAVIAGIIAFITLRRKRS